MTAQFHENLILNGERTTMAFCPPIPHAHPRIRTLTGQQIRDGIQNKTVHPYVLSTACWRHYVGTWEIKDDLFYLVGVSGLYELLGDEPLLADWFTGVLRIPRGKQLRYVHMGFGSVYEEELHVKLEAGRVVKSRLIYNGDKSSSDELAMRNLPGGENNFDGDDL